MQLNADELAKEILERCDNDRADVKDAYNMFVSTYQRQELNPEGVPDSVVNGITKALQLRLDASDKAINQLIKLLTPSTGPIKQKSLKEILLEGDNKETI